MTSMRLLTAEGCIAKKRTSTYANSTFNNNINSIVRFGLLYRIFYPRPEFRRRFLFGKSAVLPTSGGPSRLENCEFVGNMAQSFASNSINQSSIATAAGCLYKPRPLRIWCSWMGVPLTTTWPLWATRMILRDRVGIVFYGFGPHIPQPNFGNKARAAKGDVLGGGAYVNGNVQVASCLIARNNVESPNKAHGGGIYNLGTSTMSNLTVAKNWITSSTPADDLSSGCYNGSTWSMYNSIVYYNTTVDCYYGSSSYLPFNSVIQSFPNGATNYNIPPFFVDTAANDYHVAPTRLPSTAETTPTFRRD